MHLNGDPEPLALAGVFSILSAIGPGGPEDGRSGFLSQTIASNALNCSVIAKCQS